MFSPWYAWARRRGPTDPLACSALNVALYGEGGKRWALTERPAAAVARDADRLAIGPSMLAWEDGVLTVRIHEVSAPIPSRISGTVRLRPAALTNRVFTLDRAGRHRWSLLAPCGRVDVAFERPARRWQGSAYFDSNDGDEPLEASFRDWQWSRASLSRGTAVLYDVARRDGSSLSLSLLVDPSGGVGVFETERKVDLPRTLWRISRHTRADANAAPIIQQTLEDAPFYARSVMRTRLLGEAVSAVHESLSLDRFATAWVQAMLPFRVPRARH